MLSTYGRRAVEQHLYKSGESSGVKIFHIITSDILREETNLLNRTVFTQHTNDSCKSTTGWLSNMFRPCSAIIRLTKK